MKRFCRCFGYVLCWISKPKKKHKRVTFKDGHMRSDRRPRGDPSTEGGDSGPPSRALSTSSAGSRTGIVQVEINKKPGCNLGLVVTGGVDKDLKPRISYLKPGGIAHRSDVLEEGDYILSVNGLATQNMKHDDIVNTLRTASENIMLQLQYELPDMPQSGFSVMCKRIEVQLDVADGDSVGFTLRGGVDAEPSLSRPLTITQIRPGGAAHREGTLKVGDRILAINGVNMTQSCLEDALSLIRHSRDVTTLLVEYDVSVMDAVEKACGPLLVEIDKAPGSGLGIYVTSTVSKGANAICIQSIQPASIADRCGALHVGDIILAVDDTSFEHVSVAESTQILKCTTGSHVRLEIVPVRHLRSQSQGELSMLSSNIDQQVPAAGSTTSTHSGGSGSGKGVGTGMAAKSSTPNYAPRSNGHIVKSQTLPPPSKSTLEDLTAARRKLEAEINSEAGSERGSQPQRQHNRNVCNNNTGLHTAQVHSSQTSLTSFGTYTSLVTQMGSALSSPNGTLTRSARPSIRPSVPRGAQQPSRKNTSPDDFEEFPPPPPPIDGTEFDSEQARNELGSSDGTSSVGSLAYSMSPHHHHQVCRTESLSGTVLVADRAGFGISLGATGYPEDVMPDPPFISFIEPKSVAERCGVLAEGDRVISVNGQALAGRCLDDAIKLLNESGMRITLQTEFDVAESVVQCSGIFNVKVARNGSGLGLTIAATKHRKHNDPLLISDVKRGSVAHRTGTIEPGDQLLGVNNFRLEGCSVEDAAHILQNTENIVQLRLKKKDVYTRDENDNNNSISYTVELQRKSGPLGITISGTEEPNDPIFISGLSEGGLAEKTGALHVGDRILSINSRSLRDKTLTDAIKLLQQAGHTVTLHISRPTSTEPHKQGLTGKAHDSVDSALESWDSSGLDSNGKGSNGVSQLQRNESVSSAGATSALDQSLPTPTPEPPLPHHPSSSTTSTPQSDPSSLPLPPPPPELTTPATTNGHTRNSATSYNDLSQELRYSYGSDTSSAGSRQSAEFSGARPKTTGHRVNNKANNTSSASSSCDKPNKMADISRLKPELSRGTRDNSSRIKLHIQESGDNSVISSLDQDEWSRQLDQLDSLGTLALHSQSDSFSAFNQSESSAQNEAGAKSTQKTQNITATEPSSKEHYATTLRHKHDSLNTNSRSRDLVESPRVNSRDLSDLADSPPEDSSRDRSSSSQRDFAPKTHREQTVTFSPAHDEYRHQSNSRDREKTLVEKSRNITSPSLHRRGGENKPGILSSKQKGAENNPALSLSNRTHPTLNHKMRENPSSMREISQTPPPLLRGENNPKKSHSQLHQGAALQLQEVEEQLEKMRTPAPAELLRVTLCKHNEPDYGMSVSDGVYERGVYISAIRPNGPAHQAQLLPFDRILQINDVTLRDMECRDVVPLIANTGARLSLVISRNPLAQALLLRGGGDGGALGAGEVEVDLEEEDCSSLGESASVILEGRMV